MSAAVLIRTFVMVPDRIAEIERAGIRGRAGHGTGGGTDCGARSRISRSRADDGARARAKERARRCPVSRVRAASRQNKGRCERGPHRKTFDHFHCLLLSAVNH
jgi:hypothetical protein